MALEPPGPPWPVAQRSPPPGVWASGFVQMPWTHCTALPSQVQPDSGSCTFFPQSLAVLQLTVLYPGLLEHLWSGIS